MNRERPNAAARNCDHIAFSHGPVSWVPSYLRRVAALDRLRKRSRLPPKLQRLLRYHEKWRVEECLNLLPSENFASPAVLEVLGSDLSNRYSSPEGFYMGTRYIDEIQAETEKLARQVFRAKFADVRPVSGHVADMIVLTALAKRGDRVVVVGKNVGGYPGISQEAFPDLCGLQVSEFPFNKQIFNLDEEKAIALLERERPKLVVFGASLILFPYPLRTLSETCHTIGANVAYDASHVLGLIAGGEFQDPLREGADVLFGSTHKSFFGPQGGIILSNVHEEEIQRAVYPSMVDNAHWNRIAALYVALDETRRFGRQYARQVVRNSKALAKALHEQGVKLLGRDRGFTESHQTIVEVGSQKHALQLARRLEEINIIVDIGIRIGTCGETRRGMREPEMEQIAEIISGAWLRRENPRDLKRQVIRLRREFPSIRYC